MGWTDFLGPIGAALGAGVGILVAPGAGTAYGAAIGGSIGGGVSSMMGQQEVNQQQIAMWERQMGWQEKMSNTAYQRAMADMRDAGLNPMLAYQQGGASTPSGGGAPSLGNPSKALEGVGNNMMEFASAKASIAKTEQDTDTSKSTKELQDTQQQKVGWDAVTAQHASQKMREDKAIAKAERVQAEVDAKVAKAGEKARVNAAKVSPYVDVGSKAVNALTGIMSGSAKAAGAMLRGASGGGYNPNKDVRDTMSGRTMDWKKGRR